MHLERGRFLLRKSVCHDLAATGGICCALALIVAGLAQGQIAPAERSLSDKAFRDPSLHVARRQVGVSEVAPAIAPQLVRRLTSLGASADGAFVDRRSGRWATILLRAPLVPGHGVGNDLDWGDLGRLQPAAERAPLAEVVRVALERWIRMHAADLELDPRELATPARVTLHEDGGLVQVQVGRRVGDVPVRDSYLTAVVNHGNLVLFGSTHWGDIETPTRASLSSADAERVLSRHLEAIEIEGWRRAPELALVPTAATSDPRSSPFGQGYRYRLVWVLRPVLAADPGRWEAMVDAHDGSLLAFSDTLRYASTRRVGGGVYPVSNDGTPPEGVEQPNYPMPHADLATPQGTFFTDAGGNYPVCVDGEVTTTLNGRYVRIDDVCGPIAESSTGNLDLGTGPGLDCDVPAGSGSPGNTHSARTAFFELNRIAAQARGYLPGNAWLDRQLTAVTNIPDFGYPEFNCNAFWDETTVNFFTSGSLPQGGPDCTNTGELAAVLDHEWGHGLDNNDANPSISNPGEGIADVYAALRLNTSCIGRGFYTGQNYCGDTDPCLNCDGVRDIDWAERQSGVPHDLAWIDDETNCPPPFAGDVGPCGGSIYCESAVYSEAVWDLVHRDLSSSPFNMDLDTALEVGTRINYLGAGNVGDWYTCIDGTGTGDGCNADGGYLNYLAADDDNGDLADGTPHMEAIFAAFDRHGIACSAPAVQNGGCTGAPTTAPVVTATALDRAVHLSWPPVAGASAYQIFRTEGVFGCDFGKVKVGETTGTEFRDEGLRNGTQYFYVVLPVGANAACRGPASPCTAVTPVGGASLGFDPAAVSLEPVNGDLDPFVDNCEEARVLFTVGNTGTGTLTNVELVAVEVLSHPSTVTVTTTLPQPLAPTLAPCAEAAGEFTFHAAGLAFNDTLEFRVDVTADELDGQVQSLQVRWTGAEGDLQALASKTFSFESGLDGWQVITGTFGRTSQGGGAGGSSFYLASSDNLPDQCDAVRSPTMRLSPTSTLELSTQVDIEPSIVIEGTVFWFDRANVGLYDPSTGERTPVDPSAGRLYNASGLYGSCGTQNQAGWADAMTAWASSTWSASALQAADFADRFLQLDVRYGTDVDIQGFGLHFDEVTVTDLELVVADSQGDVCEAGNQPPIAVDDAATVDSPDPVTIAVLDNDSDPDPGDTLRILGVIQPAGGTVVVDSVGPDLDTVTYTPDPGASRVDSFQYSAGDGRGGSDAATVTVTVTPIFFDTFESGTTSLWQTFPACDVDGTYAVDGPAVQYACCTILGPPLVDIDITQFVFAADGTEITPLTMHYPALLTGSGASCPAGAFSNMEVVPGGCTETYTLDGQFVGPDTWTGTFDMTFTGADCTCGGFTPCEDQSFPVTATRP